MIETPEEFADRYWNSLPQGYSYHKGVLSAHIAARDAAIRAECVEKYEYHIWEEGEATNGRMDQR